ncbi:MAG TPA: DUF5606 domain-containing protein [Flavisolibacter sp.]|nr:DUF5606 domain-containing protein [Flavisolibacter sp.]
MDYNRIVAVTGMPGLYEVISSKSDGAIVRSLEDKSTKFVSSRIHNLSHLESIEVYTVRENVTLADVFSAMKESGSGLPDVKDNQALKSYFENVFPDLDFDRVYSSDQKKMVKWFEALRDNNVDFTVKPQEDAEEAAVEEEETTEPEATAVKEKVSKPKAKAKPATEKAAPAKEKAPAKKTAAKKKSEEKPKKAAKKK